MKNKLSTRTRGFTIIEVMIVMAIAGLILAIVFIAVPQLQRNTRDNQRQNIATRIKAEMETYASNNQGLYPFATLTGTYQNCPGTAALTCGDFQTRYITGKVKTDDPTTGTATQIFIAYAPANGAPTGGTWTIGRMQVAVGASCTGDTITGNAQAGSANSKKYAVQIALDRSNTYFCVDNG